MEQKINLKHPAGKKAVTMDKCKYDLLQKTFIKHLEKSVELTHTEIWQAIAEDFKRNKTKFEGSIQWHTEWVKLDLEANKIIKRVPKTSPQKYALTK